MKNSFILVLLLLILMSVQVAQSQIIKYEYDQAGNRTGRYYSTVTLSKAATAKTDSAARTPQREMVGKREVLIYPNPTKGALKIEIRGSLPATPVQYVLTDMSGHLLATTQEGGSSLIYDMSTYPAGIYFLLLTVDGVRSEWKIIKE